MTMIGSRRRGSSQIDRKNDASRAPSCDRGPLSTSSTAASVSNGHAWRPRRGRPSSRRSAARGRDRHRRRARWRGSWRGPSRGRRTASARRRGWPAASRSPRAGAQARACPPAAPLMSRATARARARSPSARRARAARRHRPAVGLRLALELRRGALERHAAGVVADRADLGDLVVGEDELARDGRELGALGLDGLRGARAPRSAWGPRSAPGRARGSTGRRAAASSARGARRSGACAPGARAPDSTQPSGRKARWSCCGEGVAGPHVVPEQPAVVDDAGDDVDAVAPRRRQDELAGPRLERVEDHHRPVDQRAEALQAVDDVEREAVGRAGRDAELPGQARRRAAPPSPPTPPRSCSRCGRGCAGAAGRSGRPRCARASARSPCAGSPRSRSGPRSRGSVKRGKPLDPSRSPS